MRVLITGGTGTLGHALTKRFLEKDYTVKILSRDEFKQNQMKRKYPECKYYIGDVRDKDRVDMACENVDYIIHTAALKDIATGYYNAFEMIKTNIIGAQNIIDCALKHNIETVVFVTTDKAVEPINLYGATKMCAEKMFEAANNYKGDHRTEFKTVRYGNVFGSRGSVVEVWSKEDPITVRGESVTRFHLMIEEAVDLVEKALETSEMNVTRYDLPSYDLIDLAQAFSNVTGKKIRYASLSKDEKIDEKLSSECSSDKARRLKISELEALINNYLGT